MCVRDFESIEKLFFSKIFVSAKRKMRASDASANMLRQTVTLVTVIFLYTFCGSLFLPSVWIQKFLPLLQSITYPHSLISVCFGEDGSHDDTMNVSHDIANELRKSFASVQVFHLELETSQVSLLIFFYKDCVKILPIWLRCQAL